MDERENRNEKKETSSFRDLRGYTVWNFLEIIEAGETTETS